MNFGEVWNKIAEALEVESWCLQVEAWHHRFGGTTPADIRVTWKLWVAREAVSLEGKPEEVLAALERLLDARTSEPAVTATSPEVDAVGEPPAASAPAQPTEPSGIVEGGGTPMAAGIIADDEPAPRAAWAPKHVPVSETDDGSPF